MSGAFIAWCAQQEGKPYVYGANGPDSFDCSGLIVAGVRACVDPKWADRTADQMFREFPEITAPDPNAVTLAFYGPSHRVNHVMVVWLDGRVFGASGGNSSTTSPKVASKIGAKVQFRARVHYRPDFRGFRRLPI